MGDRIDTNDSGTNVNGRVEIAMLAAKRQGKTNVGQMCP